MSLSAQFWGECGDAESVDGGMWDRPANKREAGKSKDKNMR